ncbi:PAS domain-containing protein [Cellulophaga sp. Hel_I_12]|uniref:PAS domain-containing sensor histidine kinase n=1 Tax=Cellulophaga sp. Hel_I_12 TaxID=1249972 RepID=UPI000689CCE2|nr:PAS domain-containing protein [Cellulophaga sp. Hel_I_12]
MNSFLKELKINSGFIKDTPVPIATLDENLIFLSHSNLFSENHQLGTSDINGSYFFDVLQDVPANFKGIFDNCLQGIPSQNDGKKFILNDGKVLWLKWKINPWKKDNDTVVGLVLILENITEKKVIDELTREAQEVSRTGGWQVNLLTKKTLWTPMVNSIHEMPLTYTPQTFEDNFIHFKEGEHRNRIINAAERAIELGTPWDEEVIVTTGTGQQIWVRTKGRAEFINGECVRIYGICQDIDIYKNAQLEYRKSTELLRNAITASQVGTWEYNIANGETVWDDMNCQLYGVDKKKLTNSLYRIWKNRLHPEDLERVIKEATLVYNGKKKGSVEYRIILDDGTIRFLKSTVTFVSDVKSTTQKAIGITQDVTVEKIAEKQLKEFAQITTEQNNSLTNFAHMVSHDLRSHATNLSVLTSFLEDEKDENEKKQILTMLKNATESLNSTVFNLNEVVLATDTNLSNKMVGINLLDAIYSVQNNISVLLLDKKGQCIIDVDPEQVIKVVPAYLDSILLNLFTNSLKYSSASRNPVIKITTQQENSELVVTFSDNGKGIDIEKFGGSIFGMNKTFHRNKDARGVGLYITKNQINAMGGSISVESKVNVGTTFILRFKI